MKQAAINQAFLETAPGLALACAKASSLSPLSSKLNITIMANSTIAVWFFLFPFTCLVGAFAWFLTTKKGWRWIDRVLKKIADRLDDDDDDVNNP
jgi:hypothetical protein